MNENKFISQRNNVQLKFSPLTTKCQLRCLTDQSPCAQVCNSTISPIQYEPDRTLTPTVIFPDVRATDQDGVFPHGSVNQYLSLDGMEWTVDGKAISDVWNSTEYTINTTATDMRGALTIKKNVAPSDKYVLHFRGQFLDWRTGNVYQVDSNDMALTCSDKGVDAYGCSVDRPLIVYDPLYDPLLLYDYMVARGMTVSSKPSGDKTYLIEVNVLLTIGLVPQTTLPDGIIMKLYHTETGTEVIPGLEYTWNVYPTLRFDARLIEKASYIVKFFKGNTVVASTTIGIHRKTSMPQNGGALFASDIHPKLSVYENSCYLNAPKGKLACPECYYLITWKTQSHKNIDGVWRYGEEKTWQRGERMLAAVDDLDIGVTKNDSNFDVWFECEPHTVCEEITDEEGNILYDNNKMLIGSL